MTDIWLQLNNRSFNAVTLHIIYIVILWPSYILNQIPGDNEDLGFVTGWNFAVQTAPFLTTVRGLVAGVDVDGDGLLEIWAAHFTDGGGIAGFEMVNDSTLEMIFATSSGSSYESGTRWVAVDDLDHDGRKEVIYFAGRTAEDSTAGLYVYESSGNNRFSAPFFASVSDFGKAFNFNGAGILKQLKVEHFLVADIDGDNIRELIFASDGDTKVIDFIDTLEAGPSTDTTITIDVSSGQADTVFTNVFTHSEDFFGVVYAEGDLQSGGKIKSEFATSANDIDMGFGQDPALPGDPLFGSDSVLGGGRAVNVLVGDTDGDGLMELILHSWGDFNIFVVEATGPDSYSFGDTSFIQLSAGRGNHVSLKNGAVVDADEDGKDELFYANWQSGEVYMLDDIDDDANHLDPAEFTTIYADSLTALYGAVAGDIDQDGHPDIYIATAGAFDIIDLEFNGTGFEAHPLASHPGAIAAGGYAITIAVADLDGDGHDELVTGHQIVPATITAIDTTVEPADTAQVVNPFAYSIRVIEWDHLSGVFHPVTGTRPMRIVTPQDYRLGPAYPNPFNPAITIEFRLPLPKPVTLTVYNLLGQEVARLVDGVSLQAGKHSAVWDGRDAGGATVASGVYIVGMTAGTNTARHKILMLK